jgi:hypothetical protein
VKSAVEGQLDFIGLLMSIAYACDLLDHAETALRRARTKMAESPRAKRLRMAEVSLRAGDWKG